MSFNLIDRLEEAKKDPRSLKFSCTMLSEVEIDEKTFADLWNTEMTYGGYFNNIGSEISKYKHLTYYAGISFITETDYPLNLSCNQRIKNVESTVISERC